MNPSDIINRSDALLKKYGMWGGDNRSFGYCCGLAGKLRFRVRYGHYTSQKKPEQVQRSNDPFEDQCRQVSERIAEIEQMALEVAADSGNRARVAQRNAEIRKLKQQVIARDLDGEQGLEKAKRKGRVSKEDLDARTEMIEQLRDRLDNIQDGISQPRKRPQRATPSRAPGGAQAVSTPQIREDAPLMNPAYFHHTDETRQFDQEWQEAKKRQDAQLDRIGQGVGNLKNMANEMGEHLDRQDVYIDDMERQVDQVTEQIKTNNVKLRSALTQMRSTRNICIDITLVVIVLAIGAYIYTQLT